MAIGEKIRVLVADDSAFMRKVLLSILDSDGSFEVVGEARDGREAVEKSAKLKPHVITMDINMPHMDGLQATEIIMSTEPRPILIVSSESKDGASHACARWSWEPSILSPSPAAASIWICPACARSWCASCALPPRFASCAICCAPAPAKVARVEEPRPEFCCRAVTNGTRLPVAVLAASTGGPATLMKLVPEFAADFPGAMLVVQHMPGALLPVCRTACGVSQIPVKHAENGEPLRAGHVYVCPGDCHLRVAPPGRIVLDDGPRIAGYRPSIDVTLESVAALAGANAVAAILTGMGNDGARGVMAIQENGGLVLAQDEATSVIFGMPAEAIKTGAVGQVLPLEQIAAAITRRVAFYRRSAGGGRMTVVRLRSACPGRCRAGGCGERERAAALVCLAPAKAGGGHGRTGDPVHRGRMAICRGGQRGRGDSRL